MRYDMRLRKVGLGKKMRFFLLVIVGLLMALSVYNVYRVFGEPEMINKNVPVYNFQHQGEMDYRVQLKPNTIISETEMHQDEVYYSKLVESIDTDFSYSYTADQPAKLKVIYDVVAVVEAPEMWKKEFPLIPETVVEEEGKTVSFNRPFSFTLEPYQDYVNKVNEELGVNARDPGVIVQANINVVAESAAGQSSERLTPTMEIPLSAGEFKIGGTLSPEKSGVHTAAKMVPNPGLQGRMTRHVLFLGILIVFGAITLLWTEVKEPVQIKEVDQIWRQYKDRLVKADRNFVVPDDLVFVPLGSMDDLIKVADEAGKPIIFQDATTSEIKPGCYVLDGLTVYKYVITEFEGVVLQNDIEAVFPS
jgi:hypothetical protein